MNLFLPVIESELVWHIYSIWHCSKMPSNMHVESHYMQVVSWTCNVCHNSLMYVLVMKSSAFVQHPQMKQYSGLIITHYQVSAPLNSVLLDLIHHLQRIWKWFTVTILATSHLAWATMPVLEWGTVPQSFNLDAPSHVIHVISVHGVWQTAQVCTHKYKPDNQKQMSKQTKKKKKTSN